MHELQIKLKAQRLRERQAGIGDLLAEELRQPTSAQVEGCLAQLTLGEKLLVTTRLLRRERRRTLW